MSFKSDWNKISADGMRILLQNKWSQLKTVSLSNLFNYVGGNEIGDYGFALLMEK